MKVWVVKEGCDEHGYTTAGVYSNKEAAEQCKKFYHYHGGNATVFEVEDVFRSPDQKFRDAVAKEGAA